MAYYKLDKKKFARLKKEAQQFQEDIVCAVGTDFMQTIAEAENRMIFDILKGIESESAADVEVVRHGEWIYKTTYGQLDECNCSLCGQLMTTIEGKRMNYCCRCGAKMDGGKAE